MQYREPLLWGIAGLYQGNTSIYSSKSFIPHIEVVRKPVKSGSTSICKCGRFVGIRNIFVIRNGYTNMFSYNDFEIKYSQFNL